VLGKVEGEGALWHGHVTAVSVASDCRRLGLATKLMNMLEETTEKVYVLSINTAYSVRIGHGMCSCITIAALFSLHSCHLAKSMPHFRRRILLTNTTTLQGKRALLQVHACGGLSLSSPLAWCCCSRFLSNPAHIQAQWLLR
jgi:hypothetical protein